MSKRRILAAMSGGVDSSVAAALLCEAGHEAIEIGGIHARTWCNEEASRFSWSFSAAVRQ